MGNLPPPTMSGFLPDELWEIVFRFATLRDLSRCSGVCRTWRRMADEQKKKKTLYIMEPIEHFLFHFAQNSKIVCVRREKAESYSVRPMRSQFVAFCQTNAGTIPEQHVRKICKKTLLSFNPSIQVTAEGQSHNQFFICNGCEKFFSPLHILDTPKQESLPMWNIQTEHIYPAHWIRFSHELIFSLLNVGFYLE